MYRTAQGLLASTNTRMPLPFNEVLPTAKVLFPSATTKEPGESDNCVVIELMSVGLWGVDISKAEITSVPTYPELLVKTPRESPTAMARLPWTATPVMNAMAGSLTL